MALDAGMMRNSGRQPVRKRDVAAYMLLPRVLPRIGELFFTGFHFFAFFMAQVYRSVRLLPADHPSLNPLNVGQYGIRDIIGEAFRHLDWKRENIDQIIVFIAILLGLLILTLQAATFVVAIAMPQAIAAGMPGFGFSSIFGVPYGGGTQDIAFILLDRVFGVPGIFESCVSSNVPCYGVAPGQMAFDTETTIYKPPVFPWPFHHGLHAMFQFYSMGLLLVGVFILLYYVIVIVAETAQTGTPFGKRFNTVWAPIRLVMAFGLLIPITNGLNSAQYITLYAAKWGSNFATNGWIVFNKAIDGSAQNMAQGMEIAVKPKEPEAAGLLQFVSLAHTCKAFEETTMRAAPEVNPATTTTGTGSTATAAKCPAGSEGKKIDAFLVKPGFDYTKSRMILNRNTNYEDALAFAENGDIQIRFGDIACGGVQNVGGVEATCGQLTLPTNSATDAAAKTVQKGYFELIKELWGGYNDGTEASIRSYERKNATQRPEEFACKPDEYKTVLGSGGDLKFRQYSLYEYQKVVCKKDIHKDYDPLPAPPLNWKADAVRSYTYGNDEYNNESPVNQDVACYSAYCVNSNVIIRNTLKAGVKTLRQEVASGQYSVSDDNLRRGWAVAGIWYNKIAEANGTLIGAAWDIPAPDMYPIQMMAVVSQKRQNNNSTAPDDMFCPDLANASMNLPQGTVGKDYAQSMCSIYKGWNAEARSNKPTGNAMADLVKSIFGIQGLFDLRYEDNARAHPLAMLVGVGKGLIEASIRNLGIGMSTGLLSIVAGLVTGGQAGPELLTAISSFFFSIATMTLTAGFILYYVIPFLPFLYFFFAVGNWLKGVFEAMVGVPLWALSHLRIDGQGLPGEGAMNGYFMLFEIFLRPILIVFGFLASISIFAAMATVFHEVFKVAVDNLTGSGPDASATSEIDKFFYTVMYAVIMYIMALSSFKLIDLVPKQIMRWMGTSVSTFSDLSEDAAGNLTNMTAIAGSQIVGGMTSGLQQGMRALGGGATSLRAGLGNAMKPPGQ